MNERNNNQYDTEEIVELLRKLELHQEETNRIIRSIRAKITKTPPIDNTPSERKITLEESRKLIGHQVKVINPRKDEPLIGFIQSVGSVYITVGLPGHKDRRRIPKNLRLIEHVKPSG